MAIDLKVKEVREHLTEAGRKVLEEVGRVTGTIQARTIDDIKKRHAAIEDKIKALQEERLEVLAAPVGKEDYVLRAKEVYREVRKRAVEVLISNSLRACQKNNVLLPLTEEGTRILLNERRLPLLFYLAVTEKDIDEALAELPDIGIRASERESRMKKIDQEISRLVKELEAELKKVSG